MGRPLANSSTSLSMYRIFRMSGFSMSWMRTPQMTPVILLAWGWSEGASPKNVSRSFLCLICFASACLLYPGQPADDIVDFLLRAALLLRLRT